MGVQLGGIWLSLLTGFGLAVVYDSFRVLRTVLWGREQTSAILDFFFMLFCGIITYLLALAVDFGRVRFFLVACEIIGACVYFLTIGALTNYLASTLHRVFAWCKAQWLRLFVRPVQKLLKKAGSLLIRGGKVTGNFLKKRAKKRKNPLKRWSRLVYNREVDVYGGNGVLQGADGTKGEQKDEGNRRKKEKK